MDTIEQNGEQTGIDGYERINGLNYVDGVLCHYALSEQEIKSYVANGKLVVPMLTIDDIDIIRQAIKKHGLPNSKVYNFDVRERGD